MNTSMSSLHDNQFIPNESGSVQKMPGDATKMYKPPSIIKSQSMQISAEHQFTPN